ncbi:MAG TPA: PDZ domain-containing protein [Vicinamibacterales bacterium]|jgi:predicted metalloprotease with PDZ domain|nr:PDZ domain-containing protein [Vicinamibacterales bacterium]
MAATFWVALFLMTQAAAAHAQTAPEPIRYALSFPAPQTHYVEVTATVPTGRRADVDLMMAVWTPGSYLLREYERNVEAVTALGADGRVLDVDKSKKNHWRVTTGGSPTVTLKYRVYCREMSVRTNWVEADFAMLNGAPTFITLADLSPRPYEITINPASGWKRSITALPSAGGEHHYRAPDYDTLVDSPIVIGNPAVYDFEVGGKKHSLVNVGEGGVFDGARAAKDLERIVKQDLAFWGSLPYDRYIFFNMITESGGGLEHKNSTVLMTNRWATRTRKAYLGWLQLASHEYFHAWNVKRLRPAELGPFDYESENITRSLWIVEGFTDYYADLQVERAGLQTRDEYLEDLSNTIELLQTTPGRLVQSAEMASFDAWIKFYRPDENSNNTSISYYTKGTVIAFLLDAKIRAATKGSKSLDDVMRAAYQKYSGPKGYTEGEFRAVAEQVAGINLKPFFASAVEGTGEVDYREALEALGLRFRPASSSSPERTKPWLGIGTRNDNGRLIISSVQRSSPADAGGLNVDDEILAIDDFRVRADRLENRLEQYKAGDKVMFLVARREQLVRIPVTFGVEPQKGWQLEVNPSATDTQRRLLDDWLHGQAERA